MTTPSTSTAMATTTGSLRRHRTSTQGSCRTPATATATTLPTWQRSSPTIKATTQGTIHLVIMSTCHARIQFKHHAQRLQIEKTKTFYRSRVLRRLGLPTWDSASPGSSKPLELHERWDAGVQEPRTGLCYAKGIGGNAAVSPAERVQANWWGNPNYVGTPTQGQISGCPSCML